MRRKRPRRKYAAGKRTRTLEGLAVGIKDESTIKGMPTTFGSLSMKDNIGEVTSPVNEKIIKAGGIVHARTATPEFSCTVMTHTKLWGVTRNPWNLSTDARWIIWWLSGFACFRDVGAGDRI